MEKTKDPRMMMVLRVRTSELWNLFLRMCAGYCRQRVLRMIFESMISIGADINNTPRQ